LFKQKNKYDPYRDKNIVGDPYKTIFVGRLSRDTTEDTLKNIFEKFGKIKYIRLVRDIVTGISKRYAFITYDRERDFEKAYIEGQNMLIDGQNILVEFERERIMKGWVPRRYGGGIGGFKESGQLRFGGRVRPFKKPYINDTSHPMLDCQLYTGKIGTIVSIKKENDDKQDVYYLRQTQVITGEKI